MSELEDGPTNLFVRVFGKALRLVGISSPEDSRPRTKDAGDPPSWRDVEAAKGKAPSAADEKKV